VPNENLPNESITESTEATWGAHISPTRPWAVVGRILDAGVESWEDGVVTAASRAVSLPDHCPKQSAQSVPQNLDSDADENERGHADDDVHRRIAERTPQTLRETVAQIDGR
jgi:hypothetical protein